MRLLRAFLVLLALPLLGLIPAPAQALSCIDPGTVAQRADSIFTGTIADTRNQRILVHVQEVRKGGPVSSEVWLDLDPELTGWWDELPHGDFREGYSSDRLWVFMPTGNVVNTCTAGPLSGPWRMRLPRPTAVGLPVGTVTGVIADATATDSVTARLDEDQHIGQWVIFGGVLAVGFAVGYVVLRTRRRTG